MISKLACDSCLKTIGYVEEFDLEGSHFYCQSCAEAKHPNLEQVIKDNEAELKSVWDPNAGLRREIAEFNDK